jgi:hypothetical protein
VGDDCATRKEFQSRVTRGVTVACVMLKFQRDAGGGEIQQQHARHIDVR